MDATIIDLRGRLTPSRPAPQPEDRAALVRASRSGLGLTEEQFAVVLSQQVGWEVWPGHITAWEAGSARVLNRVAAACRRLAMNGTTSRRSFMQAELVLPAWPGDHRGAAEHARRQHRGRHGGGPRPLASRHPQPAAADPEPLRPGPGRPAAGHVAARHRVQRVLRVALPGLRRVREGHGLYHHGARPCRRAG